jgi:hypothetical protein
VSTCLYVYGWPAPRSTRSAGLHSCSRLQSHTADWRANLCRRVGAVHGGFSCAQQCLLVLGKQTHEHNRVCLLASAQRPWHSGCAAATPEATRAMVLACILVVLWCCRPLRLVDIYVVVFCAFFPFCLVWPFGVVVRVLNRCAMCVIVCSANTDAVCAGCPLPLWPQ